MERVPRILYLVSAQANGIMKNRDFHSTDEKQVTKIYCSIGASDRFAIINVFDVSS